jgi:hypothetical protein
VKGVGQENKVDRMRHQFRQLIGITFEKFVTPFSARRRRATSSNWRSMSIATTRFASFAICNVN